MTPAVTLQISKRREQVTYEMATARKRHRGRERAGMGAIKTILDILHN